MSKNKNRERVPNAIAGPVAETPDPPPELHACWRIVFVAPIGFQNPRGGTRKMERELTVRADRVDISTPGFVELAADGASILEPVLIPHSSIQAMFAVQA